MVQYSTVQRHSHTKKEQQYQFLNNNYAKFRLASLVVRTCQVRLGSANSSQVILQVEQQRRLLDNVTQLTLAPVIRTICIFTIK